MLQGGLKMAYIILRKVVVELSSSLARELSEGKSA